MKPLSRFSDTHDKDLHNTCFNHSPFEGNKNGEFDEIYSVRSSGANTRSEFIQEVSDIYTAPYPRVLTTIPGTGTGTAWVGPIAKIRLTLVSEGQNRRGRQRHRNERAAPSTVSTAIAASSLQSTVSFFPPQGIHVLLAALQLTRHIPSLFFFFFLVREGGRGSRVGPRPWLPERCTPLGFGFGRRGRRSTALAAGCKETTSSGRNVSACHHSPLGSMPVAELERIGIRVPGSGFERRSEQSSVLWRFV
jgi:hypothetical protein